MSKELIVIKHMTLMFIGCKIDAVGTEKEIDAITASINCKSPSRFLNMQDFITSRECAEIWFQPGKVQYYIVSDTAPQIAVPPKGILVPKKLN